MWRLCLTKHPAHFLQRLVSVNSVDEQVIVGASPKIVPLHVRGTVAPPAAVCTVEVLAVAVVVPVAAPTEPVHAVATLPVVVIDVLGAELHVIVRKQRVA